MCEVAAIKEQQEYYKIDENSGAETNKLLVVRYGKRKREMRFNVISNSAFTPKEFKQLMDQLENDKMKPITHGQILLKVDELEEIKNYTYKGNEVDELIEKNIEENLRKGNTGVNFVLKIETLNAQLL